MTDGKFKHPQKGIKMDRTTENIAALVPLEMMEHYKHKHIHLDLDLLFVNKIPFLLTELIDIGFIHCKAILAKSDKLVQNGLKSVILDYEAREFKVTSIFVNNTFKPLTNWMKQDLHIDLTTCAADLQVLRANNAIRFVKEKVKYIQSETPFTKRLTIEMVTCVTVLINLFNRKSGVHLVMSPSQKLLGEKFKIPLCKIDDLVITYNIIANNTTTRPRAFFALYIGPSEIGTGCIVFKLLKKL